MSKRKVANLLALAALAYLSRAPMHPYELSKALQANGDARSIKFTHGSLYMVIQQLAKAGFVAEQATSRDGQRPERTVYAITGEGRAELREWLRELVEQPQHEYPAFVSALSLIGALEPDEVVELLGQRLRKLHTVRAETQQAIDLAESQGVHPLFLVEEVYRVKLLDAEAAFVGEFIEKIATDWGPTWAAFHEELRANS
ncbi:PadR family transcriptional regulator [Dactylosporangium sp. AC04546]|uniref:PadR family transcriptional regulator n=1 Tax=Dactylosporangium sp. AC04546 TaxID=2862460 RepID=UPI001EDFC00C|nr:PadR family transcriptional regulator [Dactylosporangium sp. AC04546]WVK87687.1 PadR family transcriptional regulator [Dactylosporangium sp. AC04546]